jgi:hypothetical protein
VIGSARMIAPTLAPLYQWTLSQDETHLEVTIPFPFLSFNTELLQVSISTDHSSILATIPSEPAIIEGTLHSSIQSFSL